MARVLDTATEAPHPSRSSPYYIWSSLNELLVGEDVDSHPGRLLLKSDVGPSEITEKAQQDPFQASAPFLPASLLTMVQQDMAAQARWAATSAAVMCT